MIRKKYLTSSDDITNSSSTQQRMHEVNIKSLKDKALDVDPDLRFMALDDFRKYMTTNSNPNTASPSLAITVSAFIPLLFRLLSDQNPDVQSQAVKTFPSVISFVSIDESVNIIDQLYQLVLEENTKGQKSRFTLSIPNMTLRGILNADNETILDSKFAREVLDRLLPQWHGHEVTFDLIELILDLVKNLGYVLTQSELKQLNESLLRLSFDKNGGMVLSRGFQVFLYLFKFAKENAMVEEAVNFVLENTDENLTVRYRYITIALGADVPLGEATVDRIYQYATSILSQESDIDDDDDIDRQIAYNILRENCLGLLEALLQSKCNVTRYEKDLLDIILKYSTLNVLDDEDMAFLDDESDDIVFSDDEIEDENDDGDGSWKLRLKAAAMIRVYVRKFPHQLPAVISIAQELPIDDKNELVSNEVLTSISYVVDEAAEKFSRTDLTDSFSKILDLVIGKMMVAGKTSQVSKTLKLVESLIKSGASPSNFIDKVFNELESLPTTTSFLELYKSVLEHSRVSSAIASRIVADLTVSLNDKSFNVISDSLKVLHLLLEKQVPFPSDKIKVILAEKTHNAKTYPSEVIHRVVWCFGEMVSRDDTVSTESTEQLLRCLQSDSTCKPGLEVLIKLADEGKLQLGIPQNVSERLALWISGESIQDELLQQLALQLLYAWAGNSGARLPTEVTTELTKLISSSTSTIVLDLVFKILALDSVFKEAYSENLLTSLLSLISEERIDATDDAFFALLHRAVKGVPELFASWQERLNLTLPLHAKALAVIAIENNLEREISVREQELAQSTSSQLVDIPEIYFAIQFLGFCAEHIPLNNVDVAHVLVLMNELGQSKNTSVDDKDLTNNSAEVLKQALAATIGAVVQNETKLHELLEYYKDPEYSNSRTYVVTALKTVVQKQTGAIETIWKTLWEKVSQLEFDHSVCGELRNTGDLLSMIAIQNPEKYLSEIVTGRPILSEPAEKLSLTYATSVVIKLLIKVLDDDETLNHLLSLCLEWLDILEIDLKQLIVGILLTCLHNKPLLLLPRLSNEVLPQVYKQLKLEDAFKKKIKMGPYTYVMDEGLEIRKLSYEFLYGIGSLSRSTLRVHNIDVSKIAVSIIEFGLSDEQIDIVILSCLTLVHFANNHDTEISELFARDTEVVEKLKGHLNKKLSEKASAQVSESHENRIKVIKQLGNRGLELVMARDEMDNEARKTWEAFGKHIEDIK